jgi:hypothetical protein
MPRFSLLPPPPHAEPREVLYWVRRVELAGGVACLALAGAFWTGAWWNWALVVAGASGLSPWPGASAILRKADRRPHVLIADPHRRAARERRAILDVAPLYAGILFVVGLVASGLGAAIFMGVLGGIGAILSVLWLRRRGQVRDL